MKKRLWTWWDLLKKSLFAFIDDGAGSLSASLSYYTVFSIGPLLILAAAFAGFIFGEEATRGEISLQLRSLMGQDGAKAVEDLIKNAYSPKHGAIATALGVSILLIGSMAVFVELKSSLNKIWKAAPLKISTVLQVLRARLLSFAMVAVVGFLLLLSIVVNTILAASSKYITEHISIPILWLEIPYTVVSFGLISLLFAFLFKFLPDRPIPWRDVWYGSFLTAALFIVGKYFIGLYLGKTAVASTFGASASVVIVMLWAYYSSWIILFGAEFTKVYSLHAGSRRHLQSK